MLEQQRSGLLNQLGEGKVLHGYLARAAAAGFSERAGIHRAEAKAFQLDLVRVFGIQAFALDPVDLQEHINFCHVVCSPSLLFAQLFKSTDQKNLTRTTYLGGAQNYFLVEAGSSATNRNETESSSNWKWGRRNATARYTPGLPATSATSMRASRRGCEALTEGEALSSGVTY